MKLLFMVPFLMSFTLLFGENISLKNLNIKSKCDKVLYYPEQIRCYDYNLKESKFVIYKVDNKSNKINIKKRPGFRIERKITKQFRISNKCYSRSGYDKGHQAFDQAFDYSWVVLKTTYILSNIIPETPKTNRFTIRKIENLFIRIAKSKDIIIMTGMIKSNERLKNDIKCPVIPKYAYEVLWIKIKDKYVFSKMYIVNNSTSKIDKIIFNEKKMKEFFMKQNIIVE